jgi:hypothetical protein
VHTLIPPAAEYLPAGHSAHITSLEYVPAGQAKHADAPLTLVDFPDSQSEHALDPATALYLPGGHSGHTGIASSTLKYEPTGHTRGVHVGGTHASCKSKHSLHDVTASGVSILISTSSRSPTVCCAYTETCHRTTEVTLDKSLSGDTKATSAVWLVFVSSTSRNTSPVNTFGTRCTRCHWLE